MDLTIAHGRVRDARVGRLGTVTRSGEPHLVPCCFALIGDVAYTAVDDKPKSTRMLRRLENVQDNPACCLLVDEYHEDWTELWWVRLDGIARIAQAGSSEEDLAKDALTSKYAQYETIAIPGPVIALEITTWVGWP
jgi:PPOX class probable F420-dependent enzyme